MFTSLKEKVVVLTGASKGIGRGMALKFAEAGAKLFLINRNEQEAKQFINELHAQGYTAHAIAADVSSEQDLKKAAQYAAETFGNVDIICANAGIYPCKTIEEMTTQEWDHIFDVNLKGTFLTVKLFLPLLKKAAYGRIILTSSITGPITGFPAGLIMAQPKQDNSALCAARHLN